MQRTDTKKRLIQRAAADKVEILSQNTDQTTRSHLAGDAVHQPASTPILQLQQLEKQKRQGWAPKVSPSNFHLQQQQALMTELMKRDEPESVHPPQFNEDKNPPTYIDNVAIKVQSSFHQKMLDQQQLQGQQSISTDGRSPLKTRPLAIVNQPEGNEARSEKIRVAVRVRPQLKLEVAKECVCHVGKSGKSIRVQDMSHTIEGQYDQVYGRNAKQPEVFQFVQDCIPKLINGFNCTIFAYGQTGSGKTYTMFGNGIDVQQMRHLQELNSNNHFGPTPQGSIMSIMKQDGTKHTPSNGSTTDASLLSLNSSPLQALQQQQGIIPRCISELYVAIKAQGLKVTTYCSFLQIYNEKLYDLLQDTYTRNPLQIREDKFQGIYVEGLSEYIVQSEADCMVLLTRGEKNRVKRATKMNIQSSRSHSLFQLLIETDQVDSKGMLKRSKLNLGDLAGSEKINKDEEMQAKHMLELRNINLSLTTLGKVIQQLSHFSHSKDPSQTQTQAHHIPFRESKLTRLLQDSIGGNTSTYLIATVSPVIDTIEETISTLKFADRAKSVMQRVKRNEINAKDDALVQKLQREVQYLKDLLALRKKGQLGDMSTQLYILRDENERLRQMALNYDEIERMKQENKEMRLELQRFKNQSLLDEPNGSNVSGSGVIMMDVTSPKSFDGRIPMTQRKPHQKERGLILSENELNGENLSESDDIQMQFQKYQSQADLVGLDVTQQKQKATNGKDLDFQRPAKLMAQNLMTDKPTYPDSVALVTPQRDRTQPNKFHQVNLSVSNKGEIEARMQELNSLKQNRYKLQQLIEQDHHGGGMNNINHRGTNDLASVTVTNPNVNLKKRYRNDSSDLGLGGGHAPVSLTGQTNNLQLPQISNRQQQPLIRMSSNSDLLASAQNQSYRQNGVATDSFASNDQLRSIQKYPQQQAHSNLNHQQRSMQNGPYQQMHNMRMSMGSINNFGSGAKIAGAGGPSNSPVGPPSIGKISHSSVYSGGIIQPPGKGSSYLSDSAASSYYYNHNGQSPNLPQTVVRIRGKNNQTIETKGSLVMSLEDEKRELERRRQIKRSNERLRMLENMERDRQEKLEYELQRISQEKIRIDNEANSAKKGEVVQIKQALQSARKVMPGVGKSLPRSQIQAGAVTIPQ